MSDVTSYLHWVLLGQVLASVSISRSSKPGILLPKHVYVTFHAPARMYGLQTQPALLLKNLVLQHHLYVNIAPKVGCNCRNILQPGEAG